MLHPAHIASLASRAISPAVASAAGIDSFNAAAATADVWGHGSDRSLPGDTMRIPFLNLDGSVMCGDDGVDYARHRVFDTRVLAPTQKPIRYIARPGAGMRPYLPVGLSGLLTTNEFGFVIVTEGELKALSGVSHGIPTIGICGVKMWSSREPNGDPLDASAPVLTQILEAAKVAGGCVVLADSDAAKNKDVSTAMRILAAAIEAQAGVPCAYVQVPADKTPGKLQPKVGLDDWIFQDPDSVHRITDLCTWAFKKAVKRRETLQVGGFVALGYSGMEHVVWSVSHGCFKVLGSQAITNPGMLMSLAGGLEWCNAAYGRESDAGISVDWQTMGGDIITKCLGAGPFDPGSVRGTGVWLHDGALVVNCANGLWRSDGEKQARYGSDFIYPVAGKLGVKYETEQATAADGKEVLDCLRTWKWERRSDAFLQLGWLALGYLAGALAWRPHISLTGPRGSGKSHLQRMLADMLGRSCIACDGGSTEPGIRQEVKQNAVALILDEAEADGVRTAQLLTFLRSATDDKQRLMGTSDQKGIKFSLRAIGMVAGIVPPMLNAADQSRFVRLELVEMDDAVKANPHPLASDQVAARAMGLKLFRRMIASWDRFQRAQDMLRSKLNGDTRYRDAMAQMLAAGHCVCFDSEVDAATADLLISKIDLVETSERMSESSDETDLLGHMLGISLSCQIGSSHMRLTVAELCAMAFEEGIDAPRGGEYSRALGQNGMRMARDGEGGGPVLQVHALSPGLRKLFAGTKWERGDIGSVLKRVPGAERKLAASMVRIGGALARPVVIRLPDLELNGAQERTEPAQVFNPRDVF